jgi:hypothetical protein
MLMKDIRWISVMTIPVFIVLSLSSFSCQSPEAERKAHMHQCPIEWITYERICFTNASEKAVSYEEGLVICRKKGLEMPQPLEVEDAATRGEVLPQNIGPYWSAGAFLVTFPKKSARALRETKSDRARFVCVSYESVQSPPNPFPFLPTPFSDTPEKLCRKHGFYCPQEALE